MRGILYKLACRHTHPNSERGLLFGSLNIAFTETHMPFQPSSACSWASTTAGPKDHLREGYDPIGADSSFPVKKNGLSQR